MSPSLKQSYSDPSCLRTLDHSGSEQGINFTGALGAGSLTWLYLI